MSIESVNTEVGVLKNNHVSISVHPVSSDTASRISCIDISTVISFNINSVVVSGRIVLISAFVETCSNIPVLAVNRPCSCSCSKGVIPAGNYPGCCKQHSQRHCRRSEFFNYPFHNKLLNHHYGQYRPHTYHTITFILKCQI